MPICPVCRSQNMETAKFCGNCGNPFPKTADTTSSLLKCEQGHIYSAVYKTCPYCPQSEAEPPGTFETRIEELTIISPSPALNIPPPPPPPSEVATKFEVPAFSAPDLSTRIETPLPDLSTRIDASPFAELTPPPRFDAARFDAPPAARFNEPPAAYQPSGGFITRVDDISAPSAPTHDLSRSLDRPAPKPEPFMPPRPVQPQTEVMETPFYNPLAQAPPPLPQPPPEPPVSFSPPPPPQLPPTPAPAQNRHTMVMSGDDLKRAVGSKGKLVGWLVSYAGNPDGEDFKLRAGYNRLGANPACDIVVEDDTVSGSHAIIVYRDGRFLIKDDLSRNGTFVNGKEINEAHPLQSYDQVRLGNTIMTFISAQKV